MPRRHWIHESNIVPATIVPEQTLVVEAQAFIDHTSELALYKRDNSSLKKQHKTDTKKIKSLEQQVKELTKERDDFKRMFEGSLEREHQYKEDLRKAVRKGESLIRGILYYEKQLDLLVKLGYIHYDKIGGFDITGDNDESGLVRFNINTISKSNNDDYTIDELRKELRNQEKKIMIQEGVIKSLQGEKVEPIHKKCKKVDEGYKQQAEENELAQKLTNLGSGEGIQVGKSMIYNATGCDLSHGDIHKLKKIMEMCGDK